jgi:hypothetical protein
MNGNILLFSSTGVLTGSQGGLHEDKYRQRSQQDTQGAKRDL